MNDYSRANTTSTPAASTRSMGWLVAGTAAATLAIAGIGGAAVFALSAGTQAGAASPATHRKATTSHTITQDTSHGTAGVKHQTAVKQHATSHVAAKPSADVKDYQTKLAILNYYGGPVDGLVGPQTRAAIKNLQGDAPLPRTGVMDRATLEVLDKMLAPVPTAQTHTDESPLTWPAAVN